MLSRLKELILSVPAATCAWGNFRRHQLQKGYIGRREKFFAQAEQSGVLYREKSIAREIKTRLSNRGYTPKLRQPGGVHTFACIPQFSWHPHLLPDLRELGEVTLFDYGSLGYRDQEFQHTGRRGIERRKEMTSQMYEAFRKAHSTRPVDWILCYGGGQDTSASIIRRITQEFGVPTANMTFDDKHGWDGSSVGEHCSGARDITREFDLFATSARVACEWHIVAGGRPIYMPEGVDVGHFHPMMLEPDIPVSFVGAAYGFRPLVARDLRRFAIPLQAFGKGWKGERWIHDNVVIFNRSQINLGMGGIGYEEWLTNVKGRDFEIPGTGGGVYITSFNPDLAQHFEIGKEIVCYSNREEMVELIRYYLKRPDEARAIAARARARCVREHRWLHRYQHMLALLGVLSDPVVEVPVS